jgi:hypothetical protein
MDNQRPPIQGQSADATGESATSAANLADVAEEASDNAGAVDGLTTIRRRIEVVGDALLMGMILAFFIYLWLDAPHWSHADQELPRVVVVAGVIVWTIRAATLLGLRPPKRVARRRRTTSSGLMDIGFSASDDPRRTALRLVGACAYIAALLVGISAFGFKVALPLLTGGYILLVGKAKWYWALLVAVLFEAVMIFVLDDLVFIPWPVPLLNHIFPGYCPSGC